MARTNKGNCRVCNVWNTSNSCIKCIKVLLLFSQRKSAEEAICSSFKKITFRESVWFPVSLISNGCVQGNGTQLHCLSVKYLQDTMQQGDISVSNTAREKYFLCLCFCLVFSKVCLSFQFPTLINKIWTYN